MLDNNASMAHGGDMEEKKKREKRKEKREEGEERDNRGNCDLHRFPNGKACPISTLYRATLLYAFAP